MSSSSDDDEPTVFYHNAGDTLLASAADKQRKTIKHFNFFLQGYCKQIGIPLVKAGDIPYAGIPAKTSNKEIFAFWDELRVDGQLCHLPGPACQGRV